VRLEEDLSVSRYEMRKLRKCCCTIYSVSISRCSSILSNPHYVFCIIYLLAAAFKLYVVLCKEKNHFMYQWNPK